MLYQRCSVGLYQYSINLNYSYYLYFYYYPLWALAGYLQQQNSQGVTYVIFQGSSLFLYIFAHSKRQVVSLTNSFESAWYLHLMQSLKCLIHKTPPTNPLTPVNSPYTAYHDNVSLR